MDASKTKKEASEIKISLWRKLHFHFWIPLTSEDSIPNLLFDCQYLFSDHSMAQDFAGFELANQVLN